MQVNRLTFLKCLEQVTPGTSRKESAEQSDCFAFKDGYVFAYNGGLSIRTSSGLPQEFVGAIKARDLLEHLRRSKVESLTLEDSENCVFMKGSGERVKFVKEAKIQLPIKSVDIPKDWTKLPEDFTVGIIKAQECAGSNESEFVTVCVHIHPKWVEAFDNFQMCRYYTDTGFSSPVIVKKEFIKHIIGFEVTHCSVTDRWIHFKNDDDLIVSCLKAIGEYPDISEFLEGEDNWTEFEIPEELSEKVDSAAVSLANADNNQAKVVIDGEKKRVYVLGLGAFSEYKGWSDIDYTGRQISFMISPKLLSEISKNYKDCQIGDGRLKVVGEKFVYCTCLSKVIEKDLDDTIKKKKKKLVKEVA